MRTLFYILLVLLPITVAAQKVSWEKTTVNFGSIRDWNSPPATFRFTNTGKKKLMFLPQKHSRDALVLYPNKSFEPGQSGEITIQYYTGEEGGFSKSIEVYTNASNRPEKLTVKGNIKSIYANALTSCPSFQSTTPPKKGEPNVIQVVDAASKRPISNAKVEVYDRGIRKALNGTNLDGVAVNWVEPGKYIGVASKKGYEKAEDEVVFSKRNRSHVIYLTRNEGEPTFNEEEVIASVNDRWNEPETPKPRRSKTIPSEYAEPELENIELGVTTNLLLEEDDEQKEAINLGITTNEVFVDDVVEPKPDETEQFNLGISSNEQWEEAIEISVENFQNSEQVEETVDLGVTTNNQIDEENRVSQIEKEVEAALAEPKPTTNNQPPVTSIPEPEFSSEKYRPNNVLLLLDVSGSMKDDDKMIKLKSSIRRLVMMLREVDILTMIAYNSTSWEVLPPTPVTQNEAIVALVDSLQPYGYTNGVKGMETAYQSLEKQLITGGNNQLIIATDGKFNSSKFSEKDAIQLVKNNSDKGIVLSIIGFGEDREAGRLMKKLADLGEGNFLQVKTNEDPTELLAEEIKARSSKL